MPRPGVVSADERSALSPPSPATRSTTGCGEIASARAAFDAKAYGQRNTVERRISRLGQWHGWARRTDKPAIVHQAALHLAAILIWFSWTPTSPASCNRS
ncbi:hypothetical protein AB0L09_39835 [Streptomyces zaomyceticus]